MKPQLYYRKNMDFQAFNDLVDQEITEFTACNDLDDDNRASIIALLQNLGVEFDGCMHCGAMPMNSNCNNAECDV